MSTNEMTSILTEGITLNTTSYFLISLISLISGFIGAYLSSYAKEKGKNLATSEDIKALVNQTKELTKTTETVKLEIANNSWKQSKKLELKLKIYIEILEALSTWRTLIQTMKHDLYNKDGELTKGNIAKEAVDNRVSRTLAIFEDIAKIEAISEMVLTSEQSQQIKNIRLDATNGTDEHDLNKAFELTIENIKSLENVIAKQAKNELFD